MPVEDYVGLVRFIANRFAVRSGVDVDDLVSAGLYAAHKALERFDPAREVPEAKFVGRRVRGAIMDVLRDRQGHRRKGPRPLLGSIEDCPGAVLADPAPSVEQMLVERDERQEVRSMVARLPAKEREVCELYFFEDLKLSEISALWGQTESRSCQVRLNALKRLRRFYAIARKDGASN